jgi:hypothetical protein
VRGRSEFTRHSHTLILVWREPGTWSNDSGAILVLDGYDAHEADWVEQWRTQRVELERETCFVTRSGLNKFAHSSPVGKASSNELVSWT